MNINCSNELQQLQMELRAQNFDIIRFSTYRTACKLRFIQKKLYFHLLDLLNVVECLRECLTNLSSEPTSKNVTPINRRTPASIHSLSSNNTQLLSINHLTTILTSIYTNLNKRLPLSQQILHIKNCVHTATGWFLYVYNTNNSTIHLNSFRVVLILLCNGKLIDKMRYLFTACLSNLSSSTLTYRQIDELLHEILALPYALQEIPRSTYRKDYAQSMFSHLTASSITLNDFLNTLIYNNTTPNCLQWLVIFHRLISVENVIHRIKCSGCQRLSFSGFRYKCQQCHNRTYQLCQDCFWRGRTSDQHLSTHEMKEYTYFLPPNKDLGHSIRKSLHCMPKNEKRNQLLSSLIIDKEQNLSQYFIQNETFNLTNTNENKSYNNEMDEHKQIASYTEQLALVAEKQNFNPIEIRSPLRFFSNQHRSRNGYDDQQNAEKKLIIFKLEAENRRILHEIKILRTQLQYRSSDHINRNDYHTYSDIDDFSTIEQQSIQTLPNRHNETPSYQNHKIRRASSVETTHQNSYLDHELQTLLIRKQQLQESRKELTSQLDNLRSIVHYSPPFSQRLTTSSPSISPSRLNFHTLNPKTPSFRSYSTPITPIHNRSTNHLRTDLLLAADSLTSAMSSLVQQLNTGNESRLT